MANDAVNFFHWYRRYKVRSVDMTAFQTAMVETARGLGEGSLGAAVLKGFAVVPAGGYGLSVSAGISNAASGFLGVINSVSLLDASAAMDPLLPTRSLVVVTPELVDADPINSPTTPYAQVPLHEQQQARVKVIAGTPAASPEYPEKGPNDVILCGIIVPALSSSITASMLDFEVRDSVGVNSLIGQNQVRFDDRMRPYRASAKVLGIKPSQNVGSGPLAFSYPGRLTPSLFPLNAGSFNPAETFVDFSTGMITGGDTTSTMFAPVVPTLNRSVVCVVTLQQNDTLNFNFGDAQGSFEQCLSAIRSQQFSGPGSLPAPDGNFGIAFVIVTSHAGAVSDVQVFDGRPFLGSGAAAARFQQETPAGVVNGANSTFTLSAAPLDPKSLDFYVGSSLLTYGQQYQLSGSRITITDVNYIPAPGQSLWAKYLVLGAVSNNSGSGIPTARFKQETPIGTVDGDNTVFTLSSTPVDPDSLDFYSGNAKLTEDQYSLVGSTVTITDPDAIPASGQGVYSKYLYLGVILGSGGGGGGGAAGYSPLGSKSSPIIVQPTLGITPVNENPLQTWFVRSPTGPQQVTATPQIKPGATVGQVIKLKAVDALNYPVFQDGNGLSLNGSWPPAGDASNATIEMTWDGSLWSEDSRR